MLLGPAAFRQACLLSLSIHDALWLGREGHRIDLSRHQVWREEGKPFPSSPLEFQERPKDGWAVSNSPSLSTQAWRLLPLNVPRVGWWFPTATQLIVFCLLLFCPSRAQALRPSLMLLFSFPDSLAVSAPGQCHRTWLRTSRSTRLFCPLPCLDFAGDEMTIVD